VKGRLDVAVFPDLCKHLLHERLPPIHLGGAGVIEIVQTVQTGGLLGHNVPVSGIVQHGGVHFFKIGHGFFLAYIVVGSNT
jgi:hypothetical protein